MPNLKTKMPQVVQDAFFADFGSQLHLEIAKSFDFSMSQIAGLTELVGDLYRKTVPVNQIETEINKRLRIDKTDVSKLALEICAKRLLIVDKEWFDGQVAAQITKLGGQPADYRSFLVKYKKEIKKQKQQEKESAFAEASADMESVIEEKLEEMPEFVKNPEAEKKAAKEGFSHYLVAVLKTNDYTLKIELNIRLMTLFLSDESQQFQHELLEILYANQEKLTKKEIELKSEKVEPTVGNWIRDYVYFVGVDEIVSSIKKAQYFTISKNVRALAPEEKKLLNYLLEFFVNLKNFYVNASKKDLAEVALFPFSEEEQESFLKSLEIAEESSTRSRRSSQTKAPTTISELYEGKITEQKRIDEEKELINKETRREYDKVADFFEDVLLKRRRYSVLACLEILAEIGAMDNLLVKDARFKNLLFGYFKRNNLQGEEQRFSADPYQAKYIQYFLKYVFLERLGLPEQEGARLAARISNIFRSRNLNQYAQLAYLDLNDDTFKWS